MTVHAPAALRTSGDLAKWLVGVGVGVVGVVVIGWFGMGQPGVALRDGNYGCSAGSLTVGGPGATVTDGEVADVWDFDMRTGRKTSLLWSDAKRKSPTEFRVSSEAPGVHDVVRNYVCSYAD